jgi:hypothetical protein
MDFTTLFNSIVDTLIPFSVWLLLFTMGLGMNLPSSLDFMRVFSSNGGFLVNCDNRSWGQLTRNITLLYT